MTSPAEPNTQQALAYARLPIGRQACAAFLARARAARLRIVFINGCFDLLHPGHLQVFFEAKRHGDVLVAAINSDVSIRGLKGPSRPILPEPVRLAMIASCKPIDAAFCFSEDNASEALRFVRPHVYAKGAQYQHMDYPESGAVQEIGCQVVYLQHVEGFSSTQLIERIQSLTSDSSK